MIAYGLQFAHEDAEGVIFPNETLPRCTAVAETDLVSAG